MDERWVLDALLGVYVGLLVGTASAIVGLASTGVDAPFTVPLGAGIIIAAVVAAGARRVDDLVDWVISIPLAVGMAGLPLLYLPYLMVASEPATVIAIAGLLAMVPGIGVPVGGALIRNRRRREQANEIAVITVGEDDSDGWNRSVISGVVAVGGSSIAVVGAGVVGIDGFLGTLLSSVGGAATSLGFFNTDSTEIAVTDSGVRVDNSVLVWDELDGYRMTDDEIKLVRPEWYQSTREFDREALSDEETLIESLEAFLPRVDKYGRVELTPRRTRR